MRRLTIILIAFLAFGAVALPGASARNVSGPMPPHGHVKAKNAASAGFVQARRGWPVSPHGKRKIVPAKHR
jgi:hypothetical protein